MATYSKNTQILDGELDDQQVMMHIDLGKYYGLNPVAKRIWDMLDQPKSFEEIVTSLLEQFEVSEEQCSREVELFLNEAIKKDIILKA